MRRLLGGVWAVVLGLGLVSAADAQVVSGGPRVPTGWPYGYGAEGWNSQYSWPWTQGVFTPTFSGGYYGYNIVPYNPAGYAGYAPGSTPYSPSALGTVYYGPGAAPVPYLAYPTYGYRERGRGYW